MNDNCDYCNYRKEAVLAKIKFEKIYKKWYIFFRTCGGFYENLN
jgi:hypothetical protein